MRRPLIVGLATVMLVAWTSPARADERKTCAPNRELEMVCSIIEHPHPGQQSGSSGRGGAGSAAPDDEDVLYWPILVIRDGSWCITWQREVFPDAANSGRAAEAERRWLMLMRSYSLCPGVARPPTIRPTPQELAREVVREVQLPEPAPVIAPGFAITGKPAYLETGATLRPPTFERPTELGRIAVTAKGEYVVDWGDGSPRERHSVEGGPWPDGRISHVYTVMGRYDVVVTVEWSADWVVAGVPGTTTGLRTSATIDDFEVRQLQAVRDR